MRRAVVAFVVLSGLLACKSPVARVEVQRVEVPVPVPCPEPPPLVRPVLPIASLPTNPPPDVVARAYAATVDLLQGYARELETILAGYRKKP